MKKKKCNFEESFSQFMVSVENGKIKSNIDIETRCLCLLKEGKGPTTFLPVRGVFVLIVYCGIPTHSI